MYTFSHASHAKPVAKWREMQMPGQRFRQEYCRSSHMMQFSHFIGTRPVTSDDFVATHCIIWAEVGYICDDTNVYHRKE